MHFSQEKNKPAKKKTSDAIAKIKQLLRRSKSKMLNKERKNVRGFSDDSEKVKKEERKVVKHDEGEQKKKKRVSRGKQESDDKESDEEEKEDERASNDIEKESNKNENCKIIQPAQNVNVVKCSSNAKSEVEKWVKRALEKGVDGLREEFMQLRRYVPPNMTCKAFEGTYEAGKSRYKDVPCQDQYRVVLKWPGVSDDYIHANYVGTPISKKRFICTQGPMPKSVIDFWHMVVQEESDSIIMLTNLVEKGFNKCEAYWPDEEGGKVIWGDIEIQNHAVRAALTPDEPSIRLCVLNVKWYEDGRAKTREVRHYRWIDWPDRSVPPCRLTSMVLLSHVRGSKKPIIVHCSAGIGRTGAIVAMEFIIERLQTATACESMDQILKELRDQRPFSIQNDLVFQQYLYIHRIMLFYFFEKHNICADTEEMIAKYKRFVEEYNNATKT
uniref:Protein-tyrosine-phosphatase n=1 Tax=Ascaris lumbricoides TaxID=6252 RepID=A0A9J2PCS1_ASCLU